MQWTETQALKLLGRRGGEKGPGGEGWEGLIAGSYLGQQGRMWLLKDVG